MRAVYAVVKKGSGLQRENTTKADGMILSHLSRGEGEANPQSLDPKGAASHSAHSYLAIFPITHILSFPRLRIRRMYHTREWARFRHGLIGHLYDILQTSQNSIMMEYSKICSPSLVALFSILNTKARACSINRSAVLSKCEQILSNRRSYTF